MCLDLPLPANRSVYFKKSGSPILEDMTKRLRNWNYNEVVDFLWERGFRVSKELGGSHQAWTKQGNDGKPEIRVEVRFAHKSYPIKTLKRMIYQSGIPESESIKWGGS